jgi:hypothetical protein
LEKIVGDVPIDVDGLITSKILGPPKDFEGFFNQHVSLPIERNQNYTTIAKT